MTTRSKAEQQSIRHESNPYKYFTMMLNMADDDLNPHEYRLLGHYVRWAGHGGSQQESVRQTAKVTRMGKSTVDKTRDALEAKGYIKVVKPSEDERKEGVATEVIVLDRWAENIARYSKDVPNQVEGVYPNKDTGVPNQVQGGVPKQVDSEELNTEEHLEELKDTSAPIGTVTPSIESPSTPIEEKKDAIQQAEEHVNAVDPIEDVTPELSDHEKIVTIIDAYYTLTKSVKRTMYKNAANRAEALALYEAGIRPGHIGLYLKRNKTEEGYWKGKNVPWNTLCSEIVDHFDQRPVPVIIAPAVPIEPIKVGGYHPGGLTEDEFERALNAAAKARTMPE